MTCNRLLILDDDPLIGRTMQAIAESAGFEARFTSAHAEFFGELDGWTPSHIALDLVMPEMDGVQVIAALAERGCAARIIITSGVGHRVLDAAGRSAAEHGLDIAGVLSKPFSPVALRNLLAGTASAQPAAPRPRPAPATVAPSRDPMAIDPAELADAMQRGELFVAYQPKIACGDGGLAGFEALVRWRHAERGFIPPDRFVAVAEREGLIDQLTDYVLERSLAWFCGPGREPGGDSESTTLSVNISARTLVDASFVDRALAMCASAGLPPSRLIFELTETSAMEDPVASLELLTRLRVKGFQLSIDDFGTGFSSMLQLARLPFSEIKVDKSFVMSAARSQESRVVIRSIVDLGRSLGLRSTAEGVEDESTLDYLREIGCDLAQGFHIGRPMEGPAVGGWIQQRYGTLAPTP